MKGILQNIPFLALVCIGTLIVLVRDLPSLIDSVALHIQDNNVVEGQVLSVREARTAPNKAPHHFMTYAYEVEAPGSKGQRFSREEQVYRQAIYSTAVPGQTIRVRYDLANPTHSVLDENIPFPLYYVVLVLVTVGSGVLGVLGLMRLARNK